MSSRELTKEEDAFATKLANDITQFVIGLLSEGERACVVLGAARLDVDLESLLKAIMCKHPGGQDNLFDSDRPLGSFSAKIALACRLGLIDDELEHGLQLIRKIRNGFAHSVSAITLDASPYRDWLHALSKGALKTDMARNLYAVLREAKKYREQHCLFAACIATYLLSLQIAVNSAQKYQAPVVARLTIVTSKNEEAK